MYCAELSPVTVLYEMIRKFRLNRPGGLHPVLHWGSTVPSSTNGSCRIANNLEPFGLIASPSKPLFRWRPLTSNTEFKDEKLEPPPSCGSTLGGLAKVRIKLPSPSNS